MADRHVVGDRQMMDERQGHGDVRRTASTPGLALLASSARGSDLRVRLKGFVKRKKVD